MKTSISFFFCFLLTLCTIAPAFGQLIIAHRGASFDAPENTLAAFRLAWEKGADGIEADFYLTTDGKIVCFHDTDTERVAGKKLVVHESTYKELRSLDVGAWKDEKWRGERIPTLEEVLATVPRGKKIFIELKVGPEIIEPLAEVLSLSSTKPEQIVVISFNEKTISTCEKRLPHLRTQWLTNYKNEKEDNSGAWSPTVEEVVITLKRIGADGLGTKAKMEHVDAAFLATLRKHGFTENGVWTVNKAKPARFYQHLGIFAITTNRPIWLRKLLTKQPELSIPAGK